MIRSVVAPTHANNRCLDSSGFTVEPDVAVLSSETVLERLSTSTLGLSTHEAHVRLVRQGPNSIAVSVPIPVLALLQENFLHSMAVLLWISGIVAFMASMPQLGIAVWLVNVINGTFSFWQEYSAEKATEALKKLLPFNVQVMRDSKPSIIPACDLVLGDIIFISAGDKIPADARLLSAESLEIDQSTLTGESNSVHKNAFPFKRPHQLNPSLHRADITNLLFAGTSVLSGHGSAVVYATGTTTEFGRLAHLTQTIEAQPSPLQREMVRVARAVTVLAMGIGAAIFILATITTHTSIAQSFMFTMGMIVAFVPEGMVPTVTLSLALAVQRMAKRQALVKRLSSVEALGCTNVICTDKTGTLTENQMTVTHAFVGGSDYTFTGVGYSIDGQIFPSNDPLVAVGVDLIELLTACTLCNNARIEIKQESPSVSGDPTEIALLIASAKLGILKESEENHLPRLHENPFDSHRKRMSTIHRNGSQYLALLKGSPSLVLDNCQYQQVKDAIEPLDTTRRKLITKQLDKYANEALRVMAVAKKLVSQEENTSAENIENEMTFLGLVAMFDPPREEVGLAVRKCHDAGIQVVMMTGDYEVTAEAIARKTGIITQPKCRIVTGVQLDHMSEQELIEMLTGEVVFARVNPEHKLKVVSAFQRCGKIVAVTGDGVNDAPALQKANIGVAMGIAGTDVAKEAADMILLDDNFASIVNAIEEGRAVYSNIKKFAVYVFTSNMAEAVPFVLMLFSCGLIPMPLTIMQMLSVDLGTDMVPAIGLGADPVNPSAMKSPPRSLSEPLLSASLLTKALLWYGAIEAIAAMSGYFYLNFLHGWPSQPLAALGTETWKAATTMTLACIVATQVGAVFCCRTQHASMFSTNIFGNKLILAGVLFELILLTSIIYVPILQNVFNTYPLAPHELVFAFAWTSIIVLADEAYKFVSNFFKMISSKNAYSFHT